MYNDMRKRQRQVAQAIVWHGQYRIFSIENIWVIPVEVYAKRVRRDSCEKCNFRTFNIRTCLTFYSFYKFKGGAHGCLNCLNMYLKNTLELKMNIGTANNLSYLVTSLLY